MASKSVNSVNKAKSLKKSRGKMAEIVQLINDGYDNSAIKRKLRVKDHQIYYAKRTYKNDIVARDIKDITTDISTYDNDIAPILKKNILRMGNTISEMPIQKTSLSQLTTSMAIMIDKLRLIEGKSTTNISAQVLVGLEPKQLEIIQSSIKSLKESMLS